WLATNFYSGIFNPHIYASSYILPSLGSLALHIISAAWFVCYIYHWRENLKIVTSKSPSSNTSQFVIYGVSATILYYLCYLATSIFGSLIKDSSINFEVNNLFNLNIYSWVGIFLLYLVVLIIYLVIEILLININELKISKRRQI